MVIQSVILTAQLPTVIKFGVSRVVGWPIGRHLQCGVGLVNPPIGLLQGLTWKRYMELSSRTGTSTPSTQKMYPWATSRLAKCSASTGRTFVHINASSPPLPHFPTFVADIQILGNPLYQVCACREITVGVTIACLRNGPVGCWHDFTAHAIKLKHAPTRHSHQLSLSLSLSHTHTHTHTASLHPTSSPACPRAHL